MSNKIKYYMAEVHLEFEIRDYPRVYPGYILFSPETIHRYKSELTAAMIYGFDPKFRKICFTAWCKEGFTFAEVLEKMEDYSKESSNTKEITEQEFNIRSSIPHWNPVNDAIEVMKAFRSSMETIKKSNEDVDFEEIYEKVNEVTSRAKEIFQPSTNGVILMPEEVSEL